MNNRRIISIEHDIKERKDIVDRYYASGILDRQDAINKINNLRLTDEKVAEITSAKLLAHRIPFRESTDEQIISELKMQIGILTEELAEALV